MNSKTMNLMVIIMAIFLSQQVMGGNRLLDITKFNNPHEKVARRGLEDMRRENGTLSTYGEAVEREVVARGNSSLSTSREAVELEAMPRRNSSLSTSGEVEEREVDELLEVMPRGNNSLSTIGEAGQELTRRRNSVLSQVGKGEALHARRRNSVLPLSGEQDRRNDGRPSFGDETGSFLPLPRQESYRRRNSAIRPVVGKEAALHARRSLFSAFWNPPSSEGSVPSPPEGSVPSPPEGYFSSPPEGPLSSPINLIDIEEKEAQLTTSEESIPAPINMIDFEEKEAQLTTSEESIPAPINMIDIEEKEAQLTTSEGSIPAPINLIDFEENDAQSMRERNLEQQLNEQIRLNQDLRNAMRFQEIHFANWIAVNNRIPELEFVGVGTDIELVPPTEEEDGVDMRRRNNALPVFQKDAIHARRRNGALPPVFGEAPDSNSKVVKRVYWDKHTCGPEGNDANWEICDKKAFKCPDSIETIECPGGIAEKSLSIEATVDRPHVINRCGYIYYVEYSCPKVEEGRRTLSEKVGDFLTSHK